MKKTRKLTLDRETIKLLRTRDLPAVTGAGGSANTLCTNDAFGCSGSGCSACC